MSHCVDKLNFLEFWVKMANMTLKMKINNLYFQHHARVSQDTCLVQIWWFQHKFVTIYRADTAKYMDGWTDGQTERQYHFDLKIQRVKMKSISTGVTEGVST